MTERFAGFPLNLGKLSRFQARGEQIETVKQLAEGKLDVVVGTHRLLSPDVRWKDLGLLVIDEEQRFGVAHKERIKKTRTQVDVLTLTATPIPRTLHLAMANLRDLSIIATPPADRRAVRTFVSRIDDTTIREAIERELGRGGQVFFITPTIGNMGQRTPRSPPARTPTNRPRGAAGASGRATTTARSTSGPSTSTAWSRRRGSGSATARCRPTQLEEVMLRFVRGELDVLVATTIVESGLDIPRANTMFVARADAFGLAQLYQLRGRIGRSKDRAYCYLLVPEPEHITDEARRRLETLQRFTELGAGFQIASAGPRDPRRRRAARRQAVGLDRGGRLRSVRQDARRGGRRARRQADPLGDRSRAVDRDPGLHPRRLRSRSRPAPRALQAAVRGRDRRRPARRDGRDRGSLRPDPRRRRAARRADGGQGDRARRRRAGAGDLARRGSRSRCPSRARSAAACVAAGWRRLPDGRYAIAPPAPGGPAGARRALLDALARAT